MDEALYRNGENAQEQFFSVSQYCGAYLKERGVTLEIVAANGIELRGSVSEGRVIAGEYRRRLGMDHWPGGGPPLHESVQESMWFAHRDTHGTIHAWSVRPFPTWNGCDAKFLASKGSGGYPYIPQATWKVAEKAHHPVTIVEGPVKALAALQVGAFSIAVNGVWNGVAKDEEGQTTLHPALEEFNWLGRIVYMAFDADWETKPGVKQALIRTIILLTKAGSNVKVLRWPMSEGKGLDDFLVGNASPGDAFKGLVDNACGLSDILQPTPSDLTMVRVELRRASLNKSALNQLCKVVAPKLQVRASTLEEESAPKVAEDHKSIILKDAEPWPEPVDLDELLNEIGKEVCQYVSLKESDALLFSLWVVLTYVEEHFDILPMLRVTSPQKRCGKSTLLEILTFLVKRNFPVSSITPATVYRIIEKYHPSLIVDEADTFMKSNIELSGIINSGHKRRLAWVTRCNPVTLEPERWSTWGPKAIAGIQDLPDTTMDRCITIALKRQTKEEKTQRTKFKERKHSSALLVLARKAFRWAQDHGAALRNTNVEITLPNDRAEDNWTPLLAIAKLAGNDWHQKAEDVAKELGGEDSDESLPVRLLSSIRDATYPNSQVKSGLNLIFPSTGIVELLNKDKEAPWADWKNGLTVEKLAKELKPYGLKSVQRKPGESKIRGYLWKGEKDDKGKYHPGLQDVFDRYLPPISLSKPRMEQDEPVTEQVVFHPVPNASPS